jgi:hypothetical protein
MTKDIYPHEWRLNSALGFGGKVHLNASRLYVTCYREDETPKRLEMIEAANTRLASLYNGQE